MNTGKAAAALALAALIALPAAHPISAGEAQAAQPVSEMTPYETYVDPDTFYNGAVLDLKTDGDVHSWITRELENMRYCYNINTINVYGLEGFDEGDSNENKDFLFQELARLGMKVVVRIESYNSATFAFQESDLDYVMNTYQKLIEYVSGDGKRQQVAYFALNMPVDDGNVQNNLGGINSKLSKERQVSYAASFVRRMREATQSCGFDDAKLYLSIFYGWDNSYQTPSYAPAGADGYFINNYSYPVDANNLPDASASDEELINQNRLSISMSTYLSQYAGMPLVVESGFHTLEYNDGVVPNQTAGLVRDKEAKMRAMKATLNFYQSYFTEVKGWLYFGYNLYKEEGTPAAVMNWSLVYPTEGQVEAENGYRLGGAVSKTEETAGGGIAISMEKAGDGLAFYECAAINQLGLRYRAASPVKLGVYVDDELKQTVELEPTEGYADRFLSLTVMKGAHISLRLEEDGALLLDSIGAYAQLEAENGELSGNAAIAPEEAASNGAAVSGLASENDGIRMTGIRGGARVKVRYRADEDSVIRVSVEGGDSAEISLKASAEYADMSAALNVPAGANLQVTGLSGSAVIDYVSLSGVPQAGATTAPTTPPEGEPPGGGGLSPILVVVICLVVFLVGVVVVTAVMLKRPVKKP